ncbi:MAG: S-layer homology domain-containing protein, partial [Clostridiales bacterium]|nr:S-layer homology domain-containing protein [Clostridiales bacterium]
RYSGSPAVTGDLSSYTDAASVSAWASDAMKWAVNEGILTGRPGNLRDPRGEATRAQVAVMIDRFTSASDEADEQ